MLPSRNQRPSLPRYMTGPLYGRWVHRAVWFDSSVSYVSKEFIYIALTSIDASMTRNPVTFLTRKSGSTTP